ncbi:MAG: ShlB/FhaC/HecB family hemolysin secretion/activation protein [Rhodocyclaceae bacterium]|nr:ShlB/FhaC/HecB family hemolysin secretion/activation protein [Rhodocyclaceae bacterium]
MRWFGIFLIVVCGHAWGQAGQTERFDIQRFRIEGASLLTADEIAQLVAPFTGEKREYGDIQRALETIEIAYRQRGYSAVQVHAPEQELTGGIVRLEVTETVIAKVVLPDTLKYLDADNLRAALPALKEGTSPNTFDLSTQIALNNENPAKQVEVLLGFGEKENTVDASLKVTENDPLKFTMSLDNTGNDSTGKRRIGVSIQHANLWNRDHVATLSYQTSPEKPAAVKIWSASYRLPVYALGGAFDFILASSTVNAGTTATTAGDLSFAGSGTVTGFRYTHALPREGDMTHKLIVGWDIKANDNTCTLGTFGAAGCGSAAADITTRPLTATYSRMLAAGGQATELSVTLTHNLPGGKNGRDADFQASRPSPTGGAGARDDYRSIKGSLNHMRLAGDWQLRMAASAQWTDIALLSAEQFGMAGANGVRGFSEREVSRDTGILATVEATTPELAGQVGLPGSFKLLAFFDTATGRNHLLAGETHASGSLSAAGLGLRYSLAKDIAFKFDLARVLKPNGSRKEGEWLQHMNLMLAF